ncbi:glycosyltransferase, partial [bacterium]|nr:glycosyltransferase [candidate division CSSED10-310 bacterium]
PFADPIISGVKGAYRTSQSAWVARFVQAEYESKYRYMQRFRTIDFIDTYAAGFRRAVFLTVGGFDEGFPGASVEDQEFSFRMAAAGYTLVFVPDARVYHRHADSIAWYFRKKRNIGFWKVRVLKQHPSKIIRDSHTPQTLKIQLVLSVCLAATILLAPVIGWIPTAIIVALFILMGWRETRQCLLAGNLGPAIVSPFLMFVRSIALAIGLIQGIIFTRCRGKT